MKQSKLSYKLILTITPLVIAPLLSLGWFAITSTSDAAEKQIELRLSNFVGQQRKNIENYLFAFGNTIDLLSHSPVLEELLGLPETSNGYRQKKRDLIDVFATYLDAYPDINSIELLDRNGEDLVFFSNDLFAKSKSGSISGELAKMTHERRFVIRQENNNIASLHYLQRIQLVTAAPDNTQNHRHWGFLLFNLKPSVLTASIGETLSSNSINFILGRNGQILFCNDSSLVGSFIPQDKLQQLFNSINSTRPSQISLESMSDHKNLFLGTSLEGDFYYFSGINHQELSIASDQISRITILMLVSSIVMIPILILVVVTRLLLSPIKQLADASNEVGSGNLTVKLVTKRNDELGLLFNDFNQMINKILSYQLELKGYHQHLEDKVSERTQELRDANLRLEGAMNDAELANQLKSRFLANMSHEIRTPLTAIIGFTEHCLDNNCSELDRNKHLNTVLRNSGHLIGLINNILDLSKIESEKLELDRQIYAISDLVYDLESVLYAQALEKALKFSIEFEYPIPKQINSDITRLKQVLLNVCSNAIKFTKEGFTRLTISYHKQKSQLCFVVQDSGIGMTEQEMERIFKPFEQADSSTTRRFGGTGLGLCISQNLAQLLGGDIVVESTPGLGSRFIITIDVGLSLNAIELINTRMPLIESGNQIQPPQPTLHFNARVLFAEDNLDNQQLIKILLEQRGIRVTLVNNGKEAIEQALVSDFDLILMDMQMPVMGGLEATDILRQTGCDIPIIALTANVMKEDIETYLQSGCNATVAKPIDQYALFNELSNYLTLDTGKDKVKEINSNANESHDQPPPAPASHTVKQAQATTGQARPQRRSLAEELQASPEFIQLVQTFLSHLPGNLLAIKKALNEGDSQQISAVAHSIKGSAGSFGYPQLTKMAATLELAARKSPHAEVCKHFAVLQSECKKVLEDNRQAVKSA